MHRNAKVVGPTADGTSDKEPMILQTIESKMIVHALPLVGHLNAHQKRKESSDHPSRNTISHKHVSHPLPCDRRERAFDVEECERGKTSPLEATSSSVVRSNTLSIKERPAMKPRWASWQPDAATCANAWLTARATIFCSALDSAWAETHSATPAMRSPAAPLGPWG